MIKIKTANNTLTDIGEVYVKTSPTTLAKIAEGYQVVSVNGAKRLIPIFLSECKHNYEISDELSYGPSCTEDGYNVYVCSKCGDKYSELYEYAHGHNYVDGFCEYCDEPDPDYIPDISCDHEGYDPDTGMCRACGEPCGHFSATLEDLETYWVDESGYCTTCGYRVWA